MELVCRGVGLSIGWVCREGRLTVEWFFWGGLVVGVGLPWSRLVGFFRGMCLSWGGGCVWLGLSWRGFVI